MSKRDFNIIQRKNKTCINVFCYENKLTYPVHISDHKCKNSMDLLITSDKITSHYVYIKDFKKLMFNKKKNNSKTKNTFVNIGYSVLAVKNVWSNTK